MSNKNTLFKYFCNFVVGASCMAALMVPFNSFAELWEFKPNVVLEERYDDNIRLTTLPHESVTGTLLKADVGFRRATEISSISGKIRTSLSNYSGDAEVTDKNNNQYFKFASNYNTELARWGFDGSLKRDTTLRSVVDDQPDDIDNGLVNIDIRRYRLRLRPSWTYSLNERMSLKLIYDYTDLRYENNRPASGLFNYKQNGLSAGISRKLSERDTMSAGIGYVRYKSPANALSVADTYSLTAGYSRKFSETVNGSVKVGINNTSQTSTLLNSDSNGYIFELKADKKTELDKYSLLISHDLQPTGNGVINEVNQLKAKMNHRFSPRLNGSIGLRYIQKKTIDTAVDVTREYVLVEPRVGWKLTRWWSLIGGYRYSGSKRNANVAYANGNVVFLSLRYRKSVALD